MQPVQQSSVQSADGTSIGFETAGAGEPLIFVTGASNDRMAAAPLAAALRDSFTCISYDRRGRGTSGDTRPYDIRREVEDLEALLGLYGGRGHVFGYSSGAILALRAAVDGLDFQTIVLYEPPLFMAGGTPASTVEHVRRIEELVAGRRPGDAVEYFQTVVVGIPPAALHGQRKAPFWSGMEAIAQTLAYDQAICGDPNVSVEALSRVSIPSFVLSGDATFPGLAEAAKGVAAMIPGGVWRNIAGQGHDLSAEALAPVFRELLGR
ncbi:alpha/beta hydrolase [Pseudarthrobacter sp. PH31-O2]|uniref:alpha/beta fold hydrolase n=1 Tax=Pseudarthrobacter sp. PH31-O2 TaxID=3046206 RepID=UPI0024BA1908|nr:alpha/beta hydrolase [Pseudarthrobacter sp. PH31-O2]MDJ0352534.1 alpha/beta hydrolase [Pseudarthrobacter sp. PH31-O2]